ncbi:putative membrane protein [Rhodopirellula maiorica SM1]|uniref:Putative membrane protein n=1 Tax=Rhodopirellula maiorica SM1 TaxID=1265738 RepID=M5RI36_9BACT|nr:poly-gamma-glutamate system protein [Rhodopirellula maiorica]EMI18836.1 putative membrane protein [Rhodopirellula maiorica SM1]
MNELSSNGDARKSPFQVMYWRPKRLSRAGLWAGMIMSLSGMALVHFWPAKVSPEHHEQLIAAATKAESAMQVIANVHQKQGLRSVAKLDPLDSHLIGPSMSLVTSKLGSLESKQTSINPNFAAVVVKWFEEAGVKPGDRVAIGASGSWPALNIAVYMAAETLQLKPTIILSAASSQYGANRPEMMWVDMEKHLHDAGLISFRATAGTYGGLYDRASGMHEQTRQLLADAMDRNGVRMLSSTGLRDLIDERMTLYESEIQSDSYAAYVNIGGGSASIGGSEGNSCFAPGVHTEVPGDEPLPNCIAARMLATNVPVINVVDAKSIAERYAMPIAPVVHPAVGQGDVFGRNVYRRSLAGVVMGLTWLMMAITVAPGIVLHPLRSWKTWRKSADDSSDASSMPKHVELMI